MDVFLFLIIDFCILKGMKQVFVNLHRFDMGPNPAELHFAVGFLFSVVDPES
jgi:hypothetical protein